MYITGAQNLRKTSRTELLHMPISERIKTVRGSLSRAAFAKKIKITESTLRNYESGLSLPNSDTIAIICETCDTDPEWLILGTGSMHPNDTSAVQQHATTQSESTASEPCVRCAKLEKELEEERFMSELTCNGGTRVYQNSIAFRRNLKKTFGAARLDATNRFPYATPT